MVDDQTKPAAPSSSSFSSSSLLRSLSPSLLLLFFFLLLLLLLLLVAGLFYTGTEVPRDYVKAFKWFLKASEAGDIESTFYTGMLYLLFHLLPSLLCLLFKYLASFVFMLLLFMDSKKFMVELIYCPLLLHSYPPSLPLSSSFLSPPLFVIPPFHIGICYSEGAGMPKDLVKAREYVCRAADAQFLDAMVFAGPTCLFSPSSFIFSFVQMLSIAPSLLLHFYL